MKSKLKLNNSKRLQYYIFDIYRENCHGFGAGASTSPDSAAECCLP